LKCAYEPAAQIFAWRALPRHLPKRLQQAVIAQAHEHVVRVLQLCLVQGAVDGDVAAAEFRKGRGGAAGDGAAER